MINDSNRKWWILIAMGAIGGLIMLDETVVGVALPTLQRDLNMSETATHWVVSAYFLVFTVFAAASGRMGDIVGFKNMLIIGVVIFGTASLACGFADDGTFLITARAIQGLGAAIIFPGSVAMIMIVFPTNQRGMAMGIMAATGTTFLAIGPLVGGFLTEVLSWHWIFWINVPVGALIILVVLVAWVDVPRQKERPGIDYGGLVALVAGLSMLIVAIMQGAAWGWMNAVILALFAGGIVVVAVFVVIEYRRDEPLIEVDLFRFPEFSACSLVLFIGQFCKIIVVVFGALYLQRDLQMSPLNAGLALLVAVAAFPILSTPVGRIADKVGARGPVVAGLLLATLAMLWIGLAAAWDDYLLMLPGLVAWGTGMSFCYAPILRAMANAVPKEKQGQTSGIGVTARLVGGTFGMAIGSTLLVITGYFQVVFLVTAGLMLAVWVFAWFAIKRQEDSQTA